MSRGTQAERTHPQFECELPATNRSLARLRARFANWLTTLPAPRADRGDLVLAISELAAAAIGGGDDANTPKRIAARAWLEDGAVVIEVVAAHPSPRDPTTDAERGFAIVASITDALSVRDQGGRTLVCARKW